MKKMLLWLRLHWFASLVGLGVLIGGYYYFRDSTATETTVVQTQIKTVEKGDIRVIVSGSGQIQADAQVDLKPVAAGDAIQVVSVLIRNDQEVQKGQVIATLDSKTAARNVREAELSLKSAKIKMQQTEENFNNKNTSDTLTRRAQEIAVKQQEIALTDARSKLSDYTIRAPFDGIVTGLSVDGGDTISQTTTLASIITKNMKAAISLNEVDAVKVKVGNVVNLSLDAFPNRIIRGKVSKLDTIGVATQGVVSYGAEIIFDEQHLDLKPGMSMTAEILVEEKKNILLISNAAITYEDNKPSVRVVANRQAGGVKGTNRANGQGGEGQRKEIGVGITDNVNTEVMNGLVEGDRVLVVGAMGSVGNAALQVNRSGQNQGGIFNLFRGAGGNRGGNFSR